MFHFQPLSKTPKQKEAGDAHIDEGVVAAAGCEIQQSVRRPIRSSVLLDRFECSAWAGKAGKPTPRGGLAIRNERFRWFDHHEISEIS